MQSTITDIGIEYWCEELANSVTLGFINNVVLIYREADSHRRYHALLRCKFIVTVTLDKRYFVCVHSRILTVK